MKNVRVYERDWCGRPQTKITYNSKPSWQRYGDGVSQVDIRAESDGSLYIVAKEYSETTRRSKEVFVSVPFEAIESLKRRIAEAEALMAKGMEVTYVGADGESHKITLFNAKWDDLPGGQQVLRGQQKVNGRMVNRSIHRDEVIE